MIGSAHYEVGAAGHAKAKTIALTLIVLAWSIFAFGAVKYGFENQLPLAYISTAICSVPNIRAC